MRISGGVMEVHSGFSHFDISNTVMLVVDFLYFLAFSTFACFSGLQ